MILVRRYGQDGAVTEQGIDGEITIGRATTNTIQLPGLLVALNHARLTPKSGATLHLECLSTVGASVNGLLGQRSADLLPGDEIQIGGHRIRVGVDDRGAAALEIHERDEQTDVEDGDAVTSLEASGLRMRRPAIIAALVVLALFIVVPLVLRLVPVPEWVGDYVPTDRIWSSGRVSDAHQHFAQQCTVCHDKVFNQVRDETCLTCHAKVAHHGDDQQAMSEAGLDGQSCASCHYEHGDTHAIMPEHPAICTDCHAHPDRFPTLDPDTFVDDFASGHPDFRVTVTELDGGVGKPLRTLLAPGVKDQNSLFYPHELHLNPKGIRGPDGRQVLACADCHRPGPGDVGFEPIKFERDCQSCHQLDVDVGGLPFRLPHGDSEAVRTLLQSAAGMAIPETADTGAAEERRRPGENAERGDGSSAPGAVDDVFERRVCAKCHEIDQAPNQSPRVRPPQIRKTWMPMAKFTHAPHQWVACDSCHAATVSTDSNDLLLPQIGTCRTCHGGVDSSQGIQSTCIDCHRFHQAEALSMSKSVGKLANGQTLDSNNQ
ncbi:MAG: FHA domain-containing protein [Pseudomonadota bacterium]|nr:FHA domain-containing protein [Pseudomonadota bacterium]